ncbi:MAG: hypothetical protein VB120_05935 [Lachnospiraceae bacterium]|nr:hypothetical protein [Lachnospiraceae bacterium]
MREFFKRIIAFIEILPTYSFILESSSDDGKAAFWCHKMILNFGDLFDSGRKYCCRIVCKALSLWAKENTVCIMLAPEEFCAGNSSAGWLCAISRSSSVPDSDCKDRSGNGTDC